MVEDRFSILLSVLLLGAYLAMGVALGSGFIIGGAVSLIFLGIGVALATSIKNIFAVLTGTFVGLTGVAIMFTAVEFYGF